MAELFDALTRALGADYHLQRQLPGGGMSAVFLAEEREFGRRVVVKVLPRELAGSDGLARFRQETALAAVLQHPNIVPVLKAGEVDGLPFFVMPFVDGESLRARLQRGPLSLRETVSILQDVARALACAHSYGVTHRDIKPDNILLVEGAAVVADFGIAKAVSGGRHRRLPGQATPDTPSLTREGISVGTPAYMAPEQVVGDPEVDHRADIYALGIVGYEMLAGSPPFTGKTTRQVLTAHLTAPVPPLGSRRADVSPGLEMLLRRCLAKDPAMRPATAQSVARALQDPELLTPPRPTRTRRLRTTLRNLFRQVRAGGIAAWLTDTRRALRGLRHRPGFALAAVLCLGLGLGVLTAISGALHRALLEPLPFQQPDRLVTVYRSTPFGNDWPTSPGKYATLAAGTHRLSSLAAISVSNSMLLRPDGGLRVQAISVTGNLFPLLGTRALRGRLLAPSDDHPDAAPVAVMSYEFWRDRYGADPRVVGRSIQLDGQATTVVGILPERFRLPSGTRILQSDLWVPLRFTPTQLRSMGSNYLRMVGRLAPGSTPASAQAELATIFQGIVATNPELAGESVRVLSMREELARPVRTPLLLLFGAVSFVLLIAASNVAALLLARGMERRRELAVRTALGGERWAVIRPVLIESLLLAAGGVALGLGMAWLGVRTIGLLAASRIPQLAGLTISLPVIGFAILAAVAIAIVCAAAPIWRGLRTDPQEALRGGRGGGLDRKHHRVLESLVVAELALSLMLLLGTGLVLRGFAGLLDRDPGFDADRILTATVSLFPGEYPEGETGPRFLDPVLDAIGHIPGVAAAGSISHIPYREWGYNFPIRYEGRDNADVARLPHGESRVISPGFFETTGQRLLAGRLFQSSDDGRPDVPIVAVVNQALADRDFKGESPVGRRFLIGAIGDTTYATIIGVVSSIQNSGPYNPPSPGVYWSVRQNTGATVFPLMIRARGVDPTSLAAPVRAAVHSVNARAAITDLMPMNEAIARSVGRPRFYLSLLGAFAAVALLLAMAGLYGTMSYSVAQRSREIGIRIALGSNPGRTLRLITWRAMGLTGIGLLIGWLGGSLMTRLLRGLLYGSSPADPLTWLAASLGLVVAALAASLAPAYRASRVAPVEVLRTE